MARKKLMVTYYNTTNLPQGEDLERLKNNCNKDAERVLLLFELFQNMTTWEAHRKFEEHFEPRQKVAVGARINGLCKKFFLYRSTEKRRDLDTNELNCVFKLFPQDGETPDDYDMSTLIMIKNPLEFNSETGLADGEATINLLTKKLNEKLVELGEKPIKIQIIN